MIYTKDLTDSIQKQAKVVFVLETVAENVALAQVSFIVWRVLFMRNTCTNCSLFVKRTENVRLTNRLPLMLAACVVKLSNPLAQGDFA